MAANKRTKFQRERDLAVIAEMYLHGKRQVEIAADLNLSQGQISQDLKTVRLRWVESSLVNIDEVKAKELAKLDELERVYWAAWERSTEAARKTRAVRNDNGANTATIEEAQQFGDPRYLQGVERCIEKRISMFGLNAPMKSEITGAGGGVIKVEAFEYGNAIAALAPGPVGNSGTPGTDESDMHGEALG